jgi:hypothetical protein
MTGFMPRSRITRGGTRAEGHHGDMDVSAGDLVTGDSPWKVALRHTTGELSHEQMIDTFTAWPWTHDRFLDADSVWPEQYVRGNWADLVRAVDEGLLTAEDYALLFERTTS